MKKDDIIERTLFTRIMLIASGKYSAAVERKMMRNTGGVLPEIQNEEVLDKFSDLYEIYTEINNENIRFNGADKIINDLTFAVFVHCLRLRRRRDGLTDWLPRVVSEARDLFKDFEQWGRDNAEEFIENRFDKRVGTKRSLFAANKWRRSARYPTDVENYIELLEIQQEKTSSAIDQPE